MSDVLVTLATFGDTVEANLAKNYLEAAGVQAFLTDEKTVNMDWLLGNAIGRIKLQVGDQDEEAARAILSQHGHLEAEASADVGSGEISFESGGPAKPTPEWENLEAEAEPDQDAEADEYGPPPTARDKYAEHAFRGAVLGVLFLPLQIYVFYLLIRVFISKEPLHDRERRKALIAALINVPIVLGICAFLRMMFAMMNTPVLPQ